MCRATLHAQVSNPYGIYSINAQMQIKNSSLPNKAFYGNQCSSPYDAANCGGYSGGSVDKIVITQEASNITLTSAIINQLNQGGGYYQRAGSLSSGSVVNVYLVYMNFSGNRRINYGQVTFEQDILGIYTDYDQTLYWGSSAFSQSYYPIYANSTAQNKFRDRKFEPSNYNNGNFHTSWDNTSNNYDWFQVTSSNHTLSMGFRNGKKGDFFRVVTKGCALNLTTSTQVNPDCYGGTGSACVSTSGQSALSSSLTYAWSNGSSSSCSGSGALTAGTYTVTVTDGSGCTDIETITITQPSSAVSVSIGSSTNLSCNGGSDGTATAAGTGGTGTITYAWSNSATGSSITGLAAGTYTVTATDGSGCTDTDTVTLTEPASGISVSMGSSTNVSCNGGSDGIATAASTGGTGTITYAWSNSATGSSITGLAAGTYTVTRNR